ncbi:hypothetical protein F5B17DRAFT_432828 [Nemania serpens]|nr:hypothetical protein F5B17DRAFT_432828 [Nemania serpens]
MGLPATATLTVIATVFPVLSLISVLLRFAARFKQKAALQLDDYTIVGAVIFNLALGATTIVGVHLGHLGKHVALNPLGIPQYGPWLTTSLKCQYAGLLIQIITFALIKISILLFYRRIFRGDRFYLITAILLAVICAWGTAFFLAVLFQCIPISQAFVLPSKQAGRCQNSTVVYNSLTSTNFVIGVSAVRIYFFYIVSANPKLNFDYTYNTVPFYIWTNIDTSVAVVCAFLPSMHALVANIPFGALLRIFSSKVPIWGSRRDNTRSADSGDKISTQRKSSTSSTKKLNPPSVESIALQTYPTPSSS